MREIVSAIENPPDSERILQVSGDIALGDKFQGDKISQNEHGNKFIINNSSSREMNSTPR